MPLETFSAHDISDPKRKAKVGRVDPRSKSENGICRIIRPPEWQVIRDSRLKALRESPGAFLGSINEESLYREDDWRKTFEGASWYGCFIGNRVVGIARSVILLDHPEERYVESLWITPEFRKQGFTRKLLAQIASEGERERRRYIRLAVLRGNRTGFDVFARLGFSPLPERSSKDEHCLEITIPGKLDSGPADPNFASALDRLAEPSAGTPEPAITQLKQERPERQLV
jgi:ribosomal protein S18 acetylase RimI-like enzyme